MTTEVIPKSVSQRLIVFKNTTLVSHFYYNILFVVILLLHDIRCLPRGKSVFEILGLLQISLLELRVKLKCSFFSEHQMKLNPHRGCWLLHSGKYMFHLNVFFFFKL